jgi:DnaJ domain
MADLYHVLGLSRRADEAAIRAAYHRLAKQFHPDAGAHLQSDERIRDINLAYETLGNPVARAAYDLEEGGLRARARRRFWAGMLTGLSTFALTIGTLPLLVQRPQHPRSSAPISIEERTQIVTASREPACQDLAVIDLASRGSDAPSSDVPESSCAAEVAPTIGRHAELLAYLDREELAYERTIPEAETSPGSSLTTQSLSLEPTAPAIRPKPTRWAPLENVKAGFELKYPSDVFAPKAGNGDADDRLFGSGDGHAMLRVYSDRGSAGTTPSKYRAALLARRYAGAALDYAPQRDHWFVLSGTLGAEMFYERVSFSCDRRSLHGWLLTYPIAERQFYDTIVEDMHRSYRYGRIAGWHCSTSARQLGTEMAVPPI